jgi:hypothetical protein
MFRAALAVYSTSFSLPTHFCLVGDDHVVFNVKVSVNDDGDAYSL